MARSKPSRAVEAQKSAMVYKHHEAVKGKASKVSEDIINKAWGVHLVTVGHLLIVGWMHSAAQPACGGLQAQLRARPDVAQGELVRVTDTQPAAAHGCGCRGRRSLSVDIGLASGQCPQMDWKLLTPENYDRTCFHIEAIVDVAGTGLEHLVNGAMGKALSVYATNDADKAGLHEGPRDVMKFINHMKLDPDEIVSVEDIAPPSEDGTVVLTPGARTVYKLFTQYLDLFGKPSREFLKKLFPYAEAPSPNSPDLRLDGDMWWLTVALLAVAKATH
eukprot:Skav201408  [mRNA]  locus=scaffold4679:20598:23269:- [translate_table: standard]